MNIEQAGVHYASHTYYEAQCELEQELAKLRAMDFFGLRTDPKDLYNAPQLPLPTEEDVRIARLAAAAPAKNTGADRLIRVTSTVMETHMVTSQGGAELTAAVEPSSAPQQLQVVTAESSGPQKVTDALDKFGNRRSGDHTQGQVEFGQVKALDVLRTPGISPCGTPAARGTAEVDISNMAVVQPELTWTEQDNETVKAFILDNPRYRREFSAILKVVRAHRIVREKLESLEEFARDALSDVWALEWEELYELNLRCRKVAAEDMRGRLSLEHWRNHLEVRRAELEEKLTEGQEELVFHTEELLRELDARTDFLELWKQQLASFLTLDQLMEWTPQLAIQYKTSM